MFCYPFTSFNPLFFYSFSTFFFFFLLFLSTFFFSFFLLFFFFFFFFFFLGLAGLCHLQKGQKQPRTFFAQPHILSFLRVVFMRNVLSSLLPTFLPCPELVNISLFFTILIILSSYHFSFNLLLKFFFKLNFIAFLLLFCRLLFSFL